MDSRPYLERDLAERCAECGYPGGYRQFWRMAERVTRDICAHLKKAKNLPPPVAGKEIHQPMVRESGLSS